MAAKSTVGALIALDGEKTFRQAVTDCNKSLSTLKSEMSLVNAESEGQANSLEALGKKHDVLSRVLEEQEKKQEAVASGLNHARESYEKVGNGLTELKGKLSLATDALEEMRNSSKTTESELKNQEKAVEELTVAVEKGEKNYQTAANKIKDWEAKLNTAKAQVIKANSELGRNAAYLKEAEEATDHCATSIDEFGKAAQKATEFTQSYTEVIRNNLINTVVDAAKEMASSAASAVTEYEDAVNQLQASTGASEAAMKQYKSVMDEIYENNYGESFDDIARSTQEVVQIMGDMDADSLQSVTESAITLRDTFDMDVNESIRGVSAMVTVMGEDADHAFDLVAKGAQNGLNRSGELTDNLAEYVQLWGQAGFAADEMFAILENGLDSGAYNLDKVNDFVKEFGNSIADGRIEESLSSFSSGTQDLFYELQNGQATVRDVFVSVINDLATMENKQEALTIASNTWSALGEDNALAVITSLNNVNDTYKDVAGTMESIKEIKYDSLSNKYEQLGRKFKSEVAVPIAEEFLPVAEEGLEILIDNTDKLVPLVGSAAAGFTAFKIGTFVTEAATAVKTLTVATEGAAGAQAAFNAVANMNPYVLLASAAAAAVTGIVLYSAATQDAVADNDELMRSSEELSQELQDTVQKMEETRQDWEETVSSFEAQEGVTDNLVSELYELNDAETATEGSKQRMKQIVDELNQLYPELSLAIDEETGKMAKSREEVEKSIEASTAFRKAKAAEAKLAEITEDLVDAELKKYEAQKKFVEISDEIKEIENARIELSKKAVDGDVEYKGVMSDICYVLEDLAIRESELNEQRESTGKNLTNLQQGYDKINETSKRVTEYMQEQTDKSDELSEAYDKTATAAEEASARQQAADEARAKYYAEATAQVVADAQSQISFFTEATNLTGEELIKARDATIANMESQKEAMENWATNLQAISEKGIDEGLLKYLAEMGPSGAEYVAQFAAMTDTQLQEASETWKQTMDSVELGATLAGGITEEIDGIANEMAEKGKDLGINYTAGAEEGINEGKSGVVDASHDTADKTATEAEATLETGSPSKRMHRIGGYASTGLANGILSKILSVQNSSRTVAEYAVAATEKVLSYATFYGYGKNVADGLAQGILDGQSGVVNAVASMCTSAIAEAKKDLDINSPSKEFASLGEYSAEGYEEGFVSRMESVRSAVSDNMRFTAPPQTDYSGNTQPASSNLENVIENALYNGMIYAMSKNGPGNGLDVRVTIKPELDSFISAVVEANERQKIMTGGIGLFE